MSENISEYRLQTSKDTYPQREWLEELQVGEIQI